MAQSQRDAVRVHRLCEYDSTDLPCTFTERVQYGVFTLFTLPVPVMVAINLNNKAPFIFQTWFCIATWYCALTEVIQVNYLLPCDV